MINSQNKKLINKREALQNELRLIKKTHALIEEPKENLILIDNAIKEKINIENQIVKYKLSLENIKADEERLLEEINRAKKISKIKENEIKNLNSRIENLKSNKFAAKKFLAKSSSDRRCGISKEDIKQYPASSYSLGLSGPSQKSTTLESSRSSH